MIFYPAPGCRSALEPGRVGLKRGYDGYSWSSTIPSGNTNAHLLVFYYFLARQASKTPGGRGFPLRCLQEHPEGVLLGFSPPNLEPGLRAKKRVSQFGLPVPRRGPTFSGKINLFPLPRSSRGGSYFLLCGRK